MIYMERDKLSLIVLRDDMDVVPFDRLIEVIFDRPSNVIYCERNGKLRGIITMGDILRASEEGRNYTTVNTNFTGLAENEYMRARRIFLENWKINALPILDDSGTLLGHWSRWNDLICNKYLLKCVAKCQYYRNSRISFVYPCSEFPDKWEAYAFYCDRLETLGVKVRRIRCDDLEEHANDTDWILTVDEDECRAYDTLYCHLLHRNDLNAKIIPFRNFLIYELASLYLGRIAQAGIHVLNLTFNANDYTKKLRKDIVEKFAAVNEKVSSTLHPAMYHDFFDDLADDNYIEKIMHLGFSVVNKCGLVMLKDCSGPYYNVSDGERSTIAQPENFERTIYFVGPCFIYGYYVEDKNTIESLLQKIINDAGYEIKVVNYGSPRDSNDRKYIELVIARIMEIQVKRGDIIVTYLPNKGHGIHNVNLYDALEKHKADTKWMVESPAHCNHKINEIYADAVYNALQPVLNEKVDEREELTDWAERDFIKTLYTDRYFYDFDVIEHNNIGSIVMNCNPFTYGHRYLIEQALGIADFLIIFVVEEDKSIFSFDERFIMVCEGVDDLKNVMVVPSGPFILSQTAFPEYFIKAADEDLVENVENDIMLFAEKIASDLNIKYRFVGEEPEDAVTNEYNSAMKRILPKYGIELVEVPRKKWDGRCISASLVRKCLEDNNMAELKKFVPESTMRMLLNSSCRKYEQCILEVK